MLIFYLREKKISKSFIGILSVYDSIFFLVQDKSW